MFDNMLINLLAAIWTLMILCDIVSAFGIEPQNLCYNGLPMPTFPAYTREDLSRQHASKTAPKLS